MSRFCGAAILVTMCCSPVVEAGYSQSVTRRLKLRDCDQSRVSIDLIADNSTITTYASIFDRFNYPEIRPF